MYDRNEIYLTPGTIALYKEFLTNPGKYGFTYKPLKECFLLGDHYEPQHLLFEQYVKYINKPLSKMVFYIIMREEFYDKFGADEKRDNDGKLLSRGMLGYRLRLNPECVKK